jgi:hypothetical protein
MLHRARPQGSGAGRAGSGLIEGLRRRCRSPGSLRRAGGGVAATCTGSGGAPDPAWDRATHGGRGRPIRWPQDHFPTYPHKGGSTAAAPPAASSGRRSLPRNGTTQTGAVGACVTGGGGGVRTTTAREAAGSARAGRRRGGRAGQGADADRGERGTAPPQTSEQARVGTTRARTPAERGFASSLRLLCVFDLDRRVRCDDVVGGSRRVGRTSALRPPFAPTRPRSLRSVLAVWVHGGGGGRVDCPKEDR